MLDAILEQLQRYVDVPFEKTTLDGEDAFLLSLKDKEEMWVRDLNPGIYMFSQVYPLISAEDNETFYSYLMRANFFGQGTAQGILAIDPDEKFITLCKIIQQDISVSMFRDELEIFLNYHSYWQDKIAEFNPKSPNQNQ